MKLCVFAVFLLTCFLTSIESSKILIVAPMPSYSHFSIPFRLAQELASRNHQITCINAFPQKTPIENYRDISVEENHIIIEETKKKLFSREKLGVIENLTSLFDLILAVTENTLKNRNVVQLLNSGERFDLVIIENFFNDVFVGLGYRFKAPVILVSATASSAMNNYIFANPAPTSYVPGLGGTLTKHMSFWGRLENLLMNSVFYALIQLYHMPQQREIFAKYITRRADLDDVLYNNVSLMLTNSHVSVSDAVPLVPSIVEIGGFHVKPPKKLPEELQEFLDQASDGAILFSMGSNLKSQDLKAETQKGILEAFAKIKQRVLWKFETELPDLPPNVKIMKWLPQQDVLAHRNVRAFISHGGFLSTLEAVYFAIPMIGVPVFGDQKHNVAAAVENGYAVGINLEELSEETLSRALNEILNNAKYKANVQQRSRLMHDRAVQPIDLAIFWIEHVIRNKGAPHLRSAALDLKWYQRELVDVVLFLVVIVFVIAALFCNVVKKICCFFFRGDKLAKSKKNQ